MHTKYQMIAQDIQRQIQNGELAPGERLPKEDVYMQRYCVSSMTVRKALDQLAKHGQIYRVRGKGSFVFENHGSAAMKQVAAILPLERQPNISQLRLLRGIQQFLESKQYTLHIEWFEQDDEKIPAMVNQLLEHDVVGFLIYPYDPTRARPVLKALLDQKIAFVCLEHDDCLYGASCVGPDHFAGGVLAAKCLTELGHQKVRYAAEDLKRSAVSMRFDGFRYMMASCGIADVPLVETSGATISPALAEEIRRGEVTAIFCATDGIAHRLIRALQAERLRVPQDVSIVGVDRWDDGSDGTMQLTTIRQDFEAVGMAAAKLLYDLLSQAKLPVPLHILTRVELVEGATTARLDASQKTGEPVELLLTAPPRSHPKCGSLAP
ncbi:MAG: GntR family transcriptional regulator [Clostridia bacterium]